MRAFLAYVDALEAWNFKDVMECFDEALEHRILPQSLGRPVLNKRQYGEYIRAVMPLIKRFQITIHEVIEAGDKMTVHVRFLIPHQTISLHPTFAPTLGLKTYLT